MEGTCTCCQKTKKSKKKDKEKEKNEGGKETGREKAKASKTKELNGNAAGSPGVARQKSVKSEKSKVVSNPASDNTLNNKSPNSLNNVPSQPLELNLDIPSMASQPLNMFLTDDSASGLISPSSQPNQNDLRFNEREQEKEKDSINNILQSWDMSSPPMGNSESLASMLSDNSFMNNNDNNNYSSNINTYAKRQIGLDPLQNFRSSVRQNQQNFSPQLQQSPSLKAQQQRGLGEISIPVDEYMKPLNKMNVHFNNFISNLSDSSPVDPSIASPNSISPDQISANDFNMLNINHINYNKPNNINTNNNQNGGNNNNLNNSNKIIINHNANNNFDHLNLTLANQNATTNVPINNNTYNTSPNKTYSNNNNNNNKYYNENSTVGNSTMNGNGNNNSNKISNLYDVMPPTPGNGLLDIFEHNIPTHKIYQNSQNNSSNIPISSSQDNEPDSLFPLFPLIGPGYSQAITSNSHNDDKINVDYMNNVGNPNTNVNILQSDVNSLNTKQSPSFSSTNAIYNSHSQANLLQQAAINQATSQLANQQLFHNVTGSSINSSASHQSFHSLLSNQSVHSVNSHNSNSAYNNSHHHHHHHHHHRNHSSHYQPYPSQQPRRSSSFLSMSSSNTGGSSVGSSVGSPSPFYADNPQLLTAKSPESNQAYGGPQLSNAKTNTTLMDDIYPTKTYTDAQSMVTKRASVSGPTLNQLNVQNGNNLNDDIPNLQTNDFINHIDQLDPSDMSLIGTVPMTSSMFMSSNATKVGNDDGPINNNTESTDSNVNYMHKNNFLKDSLDQYDEQLFQSILHDDF